MPWYSMLHQLTIAKSRVTLELNTLASLPLFVAPCGVHDQFLSYPCSLSASALVLSHLSGSIILLIGYIDIYKITCNITHIISLIPLIKKAVHTSETTVLYGGLT